MVALILLIFLRIIEHTVLQANYWWKQMQCGPPNQNFEWAMLGHGPLCPRCSAPASVSVFLRNSTRRKLTQLKGQRSVYWHPSVRPVSWLKNAAYVKSY